MPSPFSLFFKKSLGSILSTTASFLTSVGPSPRSRTPSSLTALTSSSKHLLSYYDALDLAASNDVSHFLFPSSWRKPLEILFLFLADIHPYLFTNLLRSFIEEANNYEDDEIDGFLLWGRHQIAQNLDKPWQFLVAWNNPSNIPIARIEQIERGLRLMVTALVYRVRKAQTAVVRKITKDWVSCEGKKIDIEEAVNEEMEEMMAVFLDASRLRRSVITEIVGATNVYQGALFFEALSQFLVLGSDFRDPILLGEFQRWNMPIFR
ncbi:hypothetical protein SLE2022_089390 [Rubroshorea leprosula]